jgi:hypothetical protein
MTQYTEYMMPFGWGEFEDEVKPIKKERQLHPISKLGINEVYEPVDDYDRRRATAHASLLRKRNVMDVKYAKGSFVRVK